MDKVEGVVGAIPLALLAQRVAFAIYSWLKVLLTVFLSLALAAVVVSTFLAKEERPE